jgi:Ca2+-dependent lipid-binding protein
MANPSGVLYVSVHSASNLPALDIGGGSDTYVIISLDGVQKMRTATIQNNLNPMWSQGLFVLSYNKPQ